jgi:malate dehydrogenase (oxaloacetate-decarboxylating)
MVSGACRVTPHMLRVADLRASSAMLAEAVVRAAVADGVAVFNPTNPTQAIQDAMWRPAYPGIRQNLP